MNPLVREILGLTEHELEGGKLRPETVLYLKPEQIGGESPGCCCGKCVFFTAKSSTCMLTAPAKCNAEHGVCGLFLGVGERGEAFGGEPRELIGKEEAGYIEDEKNVPTRCGNCEYFEGGEEERGSCKKVGGEIFRDGCCGHFEAEETEEEN